MELSTSHVYCFHFTRMLVALQSFPHIFYTISTLISFLCFVVVVFFSISLRDPQQLLILCPLSVRLTKCTKGNTYLFCVDRTGCWYRWKRMSAMEKEKSKESKWKIKKAMQWLFSSGKRRKERKVKSKSITKQSFNEIKVSHRKLFNQQNSDSGYCRCGKGKK